MISLCLLSVTLLSLEFTMGKRKSNQLNMRLDPELLEQLEMAARIARVDEQEVVRTLIRTFVAQINSGQVLAFPFKLEPAAGHEKKGTAGVSARSQDTVLMPPSEEAQRLNDEVKGNPGLPKARSTRPGIKKLVEREGKKL